VAGDSNTPKIDYSKLLGGAAKPVELTVAEKRAGLRVVEQEIYDVCLKPRAALATFQFGIELAIKQLRREIDANRVVAIADEAFWQEPTESGSARFLIVPVWAWPYSDMKPSDDFWDTGFMQRSFANIPGTVSGYNDGIKFYDVRFHPNGLKVPDPVAPFPIQMGPSLPTPEPLESAPRSNRGRKPAAWWPAFAEELAAYIHEAGIPPGTGSDGQGEMIDAILQRLQNRDVEASRTTIQPAIQATLDRLRKPAGK